MSEFTKYIEEIFAPFGSVTIKRMFGGYGVFYENLMIALIADELLYLKVDKESIPYFEERGLEHFQYDKKDKVVKLSYCMAPEEIYESPLDAEKWAARAYDAALRAKT